MYTNVGKKIKGLVKALFTISAILIGLMTLIIMFIMVNVDMGGLALVALIVGALVIVMVWIGTWLLYGFAELVDRTISIEEHLNPNRGTSPSPAPYSNSSRSPVSNPNSYEERYTQLLSLQAQGLISQAEFDEAVSKMQ